ncbi:kinetochore Sim4 complex subunit FTA2-domain-containing protein [Nemania abortiva]|nr:kinetochore Sim4 complex subunit FTA2-domain-containing protein [Nemania abortiva]
MDLPQLEGPKIGPFDPSGSHFHINFIERIGKGTHSVAWKVEINGSIYALSMFKYYDISKVLFPGELDTLHKYGLTDSEILNSWDPFINECRAYGRLQEVDISHVAAKCYGYIFISADGHDSSKDVDIHEAKWVRCRNQTPNTPLDKLTFRAIVKEYIESERAFVPKTIPKMMRNLKTLHKHGIIHRDIHAANYREGLLVDFSSAITVPHYLLDVKLGYVKADQIYSYEADDEHEFDYMIDKWNDENQTKIWRRFFANPRYSGRLRSKGEPSNSRVVDRWTQRIYRQNKRHAADYDWEGGMAKRRKTGSEAVQISII